jgi:indoleacetamide hydrolase
VVQGAVRAALERAEQFKDLNAFIVLSRNGALAAAAELDKGEKRGALAGLPIVVKDNSGIGSPAGSGSPDGIGIT